MLKMLGTGDKEPKKRQSVRKELQRLLEAGEDVNEFDQTLTTPLGYCVRLHLPGEQLSPACVPGMAPGMLIVINITHLQAYKLL